VLGRVGAHPRVTVAHATKAYQILAVDAIDAEYAVRVSSVLKQHSPLISYDAGRFHIAESI